MVAVVMYCNAMNSVHSFDFKAVPQKLRL